MPIYDYLCEACGEEFSREQRISDDPVKTCPCCRARKVKRLISRTSFVLKGGGWYSDLYSSAKPSGTDGDGGSGGKSEGDKGGGDKSDSKPAPAAGGDGKGGKPGKSKGTKAAA